MLTGVDCSRHQGTVNWSQVRAAGHSFAFIKATEGTAYNYAFWYKDNALRVIGAGLVLGAYHFLRADSDPAAQARYFKQIVGSFDGKVAILDVETAANGTKPNITHVRAFANEFERIEPGHPLIIYTGHWYWVGAINNPTGVDIGPLWHSEYDTGSEIADGPELDNYGGWPGCKIWQYTSSGSVPGVAGNCDVNKFFGDRADLLALTGSQEEDDMQADERAALMQIKDQCAIMYLAYNLPGQSTDWKHNLPGRVDVLYEELAKGSINIPASLANLTAQVAALQEAIAQGGVVVDYALVQNAAEAAVREVLGDAATPDA
jgi:lysozyme